MPPNAARVPEAQVDALVRELNSGVTDRRRIVIRSPERWTQFWDRVHAGRSPLPEPPAVDFDESIVVAAAMGGRPTGGYSIEIEEVARADGGLFVVVREISPGDSCGTTQAFTAPVLAVRVPTIDGDVVFVERRSVQECS